MHLFFLYIGAKDNDVCRFCDSSSENIDHILGTCPNIDYIELRMSYVRHNLDFNKINLLTNGKLKTSVEKFIN